MSYFLIVGKVPDTVRECYDIFRNLFCCINNIVLTYRLEENLLFRQDIHPFILS